MVLTRDSEGTPKTAYFRLDPLTMLQRPKMGRSRLREYDTLNNWKERRGWKSTMKIWKSDRVLSAPGITQL